MVDSETNAKIWKEETSAPKIKNCRKFHVIGVNKDGSCSTACYFTKPDIVHTLFHDKDTDINGFEDDDNDDLPEDEEPFVLNQETMYEPRTFSGMGYPPNPIKLFYLVGMKSKGIANENISDNYEHSILAGEHYAKVLYLQKAEEKRAGVNVTLYTFI